MESVIRWPGLLLLLTTATAFCVIWMRTSFVSLPTGLGRFKIFYSVTLTSGWVVQYLDKVGHKSRIRQNSRARQDCNQVLSPHTLLCP
jgi:hypothetical protein